LNSKESKDLREAGCGQGSRGTQPLAPTAGVSATEQNLRTLIKTNLASADETGNPHHHLGFGGRYFMGDNKNIIKLQF